jgi:hypothetical protein
LPTPRSPAVRDPQIPIGALAKPSPNLPAVSSLGGFRAPAPAHAQPSQRPAPETLDLSGSSELAADSSLLDAKLDATPATGRAGKGENKSEQVHGSGTLGGLLTLFVHANGDAAVGNDVCANDKARLVGRQKRGDRGDLIWPAEPLDRLFGLDLSASARRIGRRGEVR